MKKINMYSEPVIIAEIGCNHLGSIEFAKQMITIALRCGAHIVKFQKRENDHVSTLLPKIYSAPHPDRANSYGGPTYKDHRDNLELSIEDHVILSKHCAEIGAVYSTSVFEEVSAKLIVEEINPAMIKVPSACNGYFPLLDYLTREYAGQLHISLGMSSKDEKEEIIEFLGERNVLRRTVLYVCTSGYPVPYDQIYLQEISDLIHDYGSLLDGIGLSGHHLSIYPDIAAYALGVRYIERHFTVYPGLKGTDHGASLDPDGLTELAIALKQVGQALAPRPDGLIPCEVKNHEKLKLPFSLSKIIA